MKCNNCGAELPDTDEFCPECGMKADSTTVDLSSTVDLSKSPQAVEDASATAETDAEIEAPVETEAPKEEASAQAAETSDEAEAANETHASCGNCGASLEPDDKFCQICGIPVDAYDTTNTQCPSGTTPAMTCSRCGAVLSPNDRFCQMCGKPTGQEQIGNHPETAPPPASICSGCGAELIPGDRFCQRCGTPVSLPGQQKGFAPVFPHSPLPVAPSVSTVSKCAGCGAELIPGDRFCQKCGTPTGLAGQNAGFASVPPVLPGQNMPAPPMQSYSQQPPKTKKNKKGEKSKAGRVILIILILLLVLLLIAGGILVFLKRGSIFGSDGKSGDGVNILSDADIDDIGSDEADEEEVSSEEVAQVSSNQIEVPYNAQIIRVNTEGDKATLTLDLFDEKSGKWKEVLKTKACIGKNGATAYKIEGDKCTPTGTFDLNFVFGMSKPNTKLKFKKVTKNIVWIDDTESAYYNTWQNEKADYKDWTQSKPVIKKFEKKLVTYRIAFNFNGDCLSKNSAESGRGSGLFIEGVGSKGKFKASYGDIRISAKDMEKLLKYLDSSKHPQVDIY
jgi:Uncharacterized protein conserved in bacteria